jgi:serine/threonine protein phosphatase PrpC
MRNNRTISTVAKTHPGKVREQNEDRFITITLPGGSLLAIADGMGGTNAGEVAAGIAIKSVEEYFLFEGDAGPLQDPVENNQLSALLKRAIIHAHQSILASAREEEGRQGMGTTLVLGCIAGNHLSIAWSGDSRCYYYRRPEGLRQLSKDHSLVQLFVDEGLLSPGEARSHPLAHIVTQCLGDTEKVPEPDTAILPLEKGDVLLFCSDGLSGMLTDAQIEKILRSEKNDLSRCVDVLIEKANESGGEDNITVILSRYR